jgi:hypothetical protein
MNTNLCQMQGGKPASMDQYPALKPRKFLAWDFTRTTLFDLPVAFIGWIWAELKGES